MKTIYKVLPMFLLGAFGAGKAAAQESPANYWGRAYDRGNAVDDSTLVRVYDTNGTGNGLTETGDDQLIGETATFTYNDEKGWFNGNAVTDDPATEADEGAPKDGNTYFRLVRKSDGKEDLAYLDSDMTVHILKHEPATSKNVNAYTDFSVGIEDVFGEDPLKVYPVPCAGQLFIEDDFGGTGMRRFEIYNIAGQKVLEGRYNNGEQITLDVEGMDSGIFILKVKSGNKVATKRIIKIKK